MMDVGKRKSIAHDEMLTAKEFGSLFTEVKMTKIKIL